MDVIGKLIDIIEDKKKRDKFIREYKKGIQNIKISMIWRHKYQLRRKLFNQFSINDPKPEKYDIETGNYVDIVLNEDDYVQHAANKLTYEQIKSFARKHRVPIKDLIKERNRLYKRLLSTIYGDKTKKSEREEINLLNEVMIAIKEFEPEKPWKEEKLYQIELFGWLKSKFPGVKLEVSAGDIRPDIVIDHIAIEVKGPTRNRDLLTIYQKIHQYPKEFPDLILVLFNLDVPTQQYQLWEADMRKIFPKVQIIKYIAKIGALSDDKSKSIPLKSADERVPQTGTFKEKPSRQQQKKQYYKKSGKPKGMRTYRQR